MWQIKYSHVDDKSSVAYKDKNILSEGLKILGEKVWQKHIIELRVKIFERKSIVEED